MRLDGGSHFHTFYKVFSDGRYYFKKMLKPEYAARVQYREVFRKEFELGSEIDSEFVVHYHLLVDKPDECSLLMDYVNGLTLNEFLLKHPDYFRQSGNLRRFLSQLCLGLQALHQHQALHLDLKATNIMLTTVNNDVRLIDLGRSYMDARPDSVGMTTVFAAPEQKDGTGEVDARTDIYAIGRMLQEIGAQCRLPHPYRRIADRCLRQKKDERFQSVQEILDALQHHSSGRSWLLAAALLLIGIGITWMATRSGRLPWTDLRDGDFFTFASLEDTIYLQVLSMEERSAMLVEAPVGGDPYSGDLFIDDSVSFRGHTFYITEIADSAFCECRNLSNLKLPACLTTLRSFAFYNCRGLHNVHLPPSVCKIMNDAFHNSRSLNHVSWPSAATEVPRACFLACHELKSITLPEGVTIIRQDAFCDCPLLTDVDLPSSLTVIDQGPFFNCLSLRTITLPANLTSLGEYLFYNCPKLEEIRVLAATPPYISTIVDSTFHGVVRVPSASVPAYRSAPEWKKLRIEAL